jgi:hypothetical protein
VNGQGGRGGADFAKTARGVARERGVATRRDEHHLGRRRSIRLQVDHVRRASSAFGDAAQGRAGDLHDPVGLRLELRGAVLAQEQCRHQLGPRQAHQAESGSQGGDERADPGAPQAPTHKVGHRAVVDGLLDRRGRELECSCAIPPGRAAHVMHARRAVAEGDAVARCGGRLPREARRRNAGERESFGHGRLPGHRAAADRVLDPKECVEAGQQLLGLCGERLRFSRAPPGHVGAPPIGIRSRSARAPPRGPRSCPVGR